MARAERANPYLNGTFAPVTSEETVTELPLSGRLPQFLEGRYVRNGPNPLGRPDPSRYHWFTGEGMVHGVRMGGGRALWYRNRWVRSAAVARALGEHTRPGTVHAGLDLAPNTHVIGHSGKTLALVEGGGRPYALTDELDTIGPWDFEGTLAGGYSAHPLRDPATGELHAVSYYWGWGSRVEYSVVGVDGRMRHRMMIPVEGSPMMHAFSLTGSHVVLYDLPVTFDLSVAASGGPLPLPAPLRPALGRLLGRRRVPDRVAAVFNRSARGSGPFPYSWDPGHPARVGVLRRDAARAEVRWLDVEPCYVYHPLNAYDDGEEIVVDLVRHPRMFDTERRGPAEGPPTLERWRLDLVRGKVVEERLDDRGQEFPRMDERKVGSSHRWGWTVAVEGPAMGSTVVAHDLGSGRSSARCFGSHAEVGEFLFVPADPDAEEGEGVVMGFVFDGERGASDLVVLEAASLETVAAVHLPVRVPHGFHGSWLPG